MLPLLQGGSRRARDEGGRRERREGGRDANGRRAARGPAGERAERASRSRAETHPETRTPRWRRSRGSTGRRSTSSGSTSARCGPTDDRSNYRWAKVTLLDAARVPPERVHRMPSDAPDLEAAAKAYDKAIAGLVGQGRARVRPHGPGRRRRRSHGVALSGRPDRRRDRPPRRRRARAPGARGEADSHAPGHPASRRHVLVLVVGAAKRPALARAWAPEGDVHKTPSRIIRDCKGAVTSDRRRGRRRARAERPSARQGPIRIGTRSGRAFTRRRAPRRRARRPTPPIRRAHRHARAGAGSARGVAQARRRTCARAARRAGSRRPPEPRSARAGAVFAACAGDLSSKSRPSAARLDLDSEQRAARRGGEGVGLELDLDVRAVGPEQSELARERRRLPSEPGGEPSEHERAFRPEGRARRRGLREVHARHRRRQVARPPRRRTCGRRALATVPGGSRPAPRRPGARRPGFLAPTAPRARGSRANRSRRRGRRDATSARGARTRDPRPAPARATRASSARRPREARPHSSRPARRARPPRGA